MDSETQSAPFQAAFHEINAAPDVESALHMFNKVYRIDFSTYHLAQTIADVIDFGAQVVVMTPVDSLPEYMTERGREKFRSIVEELVPLARSYKLTMGLESGRSQGEFCTPQAVTKLVREIAQPELTVVPDFEAWRVATEDLPLTHVERQEAAPPAPAELPLFEECLPLARLVHAKLLRLDEAGEEPHFPISEMMSAIRDSARSHIINIEYEGWIPDIDPHLDCIEETRRCVQLIKRHLAAPR